MWTNGFLHASNDLRQNQRCSSDPGEEVIQGKDTSELPTQLEVQDCPDRSNFFNSQLISSLEKHCYPIWKTLDRDAVSERNSKERKMDIPLGVVDIQSETNTRNLIIMIW